MSEIDDPADLEGFWQTIFEIADALGEHDGFPKLEGAIQRAMTDHSGFSCLALAREFEWICRYATKIAGLSHLSETIRLYGDALAAIGHDRAGPINAPPPPAGVRATPIGVIKR